MDRRNVMGTLLGAAGITLGHSLAHSAPMGDGSIVPKMLEAFRTAFNGGRLETFCKHWAAATCRIVAWNGTADIGQGGMAGVDTMLGDLRKQFGLIRAPVAAGQFLLGPNDDVVRYFPTFGDHDRVFSLEVTMLLASGSAQSIREIRIADPARFAPAVAVTVDVPGDGRTDVSAEVQAIYDALVRRGGGTLQFPPGSFKLSLTLGSRNVQVRGAGRVATQLLATGPNAVVLRGAYRSGTWDTVTISDLTVTGGETITGVGFRAGGDKPVNDDEFVGRTRFENVRFANLDTCIDRPRGQIGLSIENCQFEDARVHLSGNARKQTGRALMHGGNMLIRGSHFQRASEAVVRIDSNVTGSGQITFEDCIMESNPGMVFDIRNLNANDSVPALVVSRCWNEQNATAKNVSIDGDVQPPVYARFVNCSLVRFDDTPLGSLTMHNSVVRTSDCSLDQLKTVKQDADSLIEHTRARIFSGAVPPGQVNSVEATYLNEAGRGSSFWLTHRQGLSKAYQGNLRISNHANRPIAFSGNQVTASVPVNDAVLPGSTVGQRLRLEPGMEVFPPSVALEAGQWIAWLYLYRHIEGAVPTLSLTGSAGLTLETPLDAPDWRTLGGMTRVPAGAKNISFWHRCTATPATIHIGGMNLLTFDTRQAARDFLNSGLFAI